jgi:hypothetical protein
LGFILTQTEIEGYSIPLTIGDTDGCEGIVRGEVIAAVAASIDRRATDYRVNESWEFRTAVSRSIALHEAE